VTAEVVIPLVGGRWSQVLYVEDVDSALDLRERITDFIRECS